MSLPHALLTALIERPGSGSELAERFDRSIGHFWHATHQQIYRELARMEGAGWVQGFVPPDAGKTRKKHYRVLPAGRAELVRWAAEPADPMDLRDAFTVKLRADAALGEVDLSEELRARITHHSERLAHYRAIEARDFALGDAMPRAKRLQHLILKKGIMYEEGSMAWAREALEELEVLHLLAAEPTDRK